MESESVDDASMPKVVKQPTDGGQPREKRKLKRPLTPERTPPAAVDAPTRTRNKRPRTAKDCNPRDVQVEETQAVMPPTPSKAALKKQATENKAKWKKDWERWCVEYTWDRSKNSGYKQPAEDWALNTTEGGLVYYTCAAS